MKSKTILLSAIFTLVIIPLSGCGLLKSEITETQITASGTISADKFTISPQVGGMIKEIYVQEGEHVQVDQQLFRLDDEIMKAQYAQAMAAVDQADTGIEAAQSQLTSASVQYDRARQGARFMYLQSLQNQTPIWSQSVPEEFNQPYWYYQRDESVSGAQTEVDKASRNLEIEQANLENIQNKATNDDFMAVEQTLTEARARFLVAEQTLTQAQFAQENDILFIIPIGR